MMTTPRTHYELKHKTKNADITSRILMMGTIGTHILGSVFVAVAALFSLLHEHHQVFWFHLFVTGKNF